MRRLRALVAVTTCVAISIMQQSPASAVRNTTRSTASAGGTIIGGAPTAIVVSGPAGEIGAWTSRGRGPRWSCGYYTARGDAVLGLIAADEPAGVVAPVVGRVYFLLCDDTAGERVFTDLVTYDPSNPLSSIAAAERAAEMAARQLNLTPPQLEINPPAPSNQIVGIPTWLWIGDAWSPISASATLGGVTATVTAVPNSVRFDMGDKNTVTCAPGTSYDTTRPARDQHTDCSHTYINPGNFTIRATLTWDVSWIATTGVGDTLGQVTRTTELPVQVVEVQAMIH